MKIGGEFELAGNQIGPAALAQTEWPQPPMPYGLWADTGRSGLFLAALALAANRSNPRVHLPAYLCESAIAPFEKAGFALRFYSALPFGDCSVDEEIREGDLFLLAHYFGTANHAGMALAASARRQGAHVIEDRVQAGLSWGFAPVGDVVVTSLRKFLPVPDGAFVGSRLAISAHLAPSCETTVSRRIFAKWLRGAGAPPARFFPLLDSAENALAADCPRRPSAASAHILATLDFAAIARMRIENWVALAAALAPAFASGLLSPLMPPPIDGEVPLGFPVRLEGGKREEMRAYLRSKGIFCPVHWALPHIKSEPALQERFAAELELASATLTFPIDQRYDRADMEAIGATVRDFSE